MFIDSYNESKQKLRSKHLTSFVNKSVNQQWVHRIYPDKSSALKLANAKNTTKYMAVAFLALVLRSLLSSFETLLKKRGSSSFVLYATQFARKFRQSFCYIKQGCPKIRRTLWKSRLLSYSGLSVDSVLIAFDRFLLEILPR